jgi:molybdopterin-guanine dinucleotide biosynthesis protein A
MGTDKALLEIDGERLWQRQRDLLTTAGAREVLISARAEQTWSTGLTVVRDDAPDCGPLGGIVAGLRAAQTDHLLVVAVDLPRLSLTWLRELIAAADEQCGAVGRWAGGHFEPLAAIYPRRVLADFSAALATRQLALQPLIAHAVQRGHLRAITLYAKRQDELANWNAPTRPTPPA